MFVRADHGAPGFTVESTCAVAIFQKSVLIVSDCDSHRALDVTDATITSHVAVGAVGESDPVERNIPSSPLWL